MASGRSSGRLCEPRQVVGGRRRPARLPGAQNPDLRAGEAAAAQRRRDVGGVEIADREIVEANCLETGLRNTVEDFVEP